ncbi:PLAC8 motif-containing protein [Artemisia annua]|uniref:PLAC8 motif-containing protein n=1 Tax=Artemisia annua TaxID=35608 RepID=A0A2U1PIB0_ARTAN|nr:PLAC8 motif-containing protein [Artemisia annua]
MAAPGKWTTGLCGCFEDCSVCCLTYWCPCVAFGRIAEIADKGNSACCVSGAFCLCLGLCTSCHACYTCFYRSKLRQLYMLPPKPCNDCCVHVCCLSCALCQEYRELKNRGMDPSLGWQGAAVNPPAGPGEMRR